MACLNDVEEKLCASEDNSDTERCLKEKTCTKVNDNQSEICCKECLNNVSEGTGTSIASNESETEKTQSDESTASKTSPKKSTNKIKNERIKTAPAKEDTDSKPWSSVEDEYLLGNTAKHQPAWGDIARALCRSVSAVKSRWNQIRAKSDQSNSALKPKKNLLTQTSVAAGFGQDEAATLSGEETSSEESSDSDAAETDRRQERFLFKHLYPRLYPALLKPAPDLSFQQADCDVLATLHSKNQHLQLLELQAGFFNATGRLIPLEAIKSKLETCESTS